FPGNPGCNSCCHRAPPGGQGGPVSVWGASFTILRKDLRVEFRTKEVFNSSVVFALLVIVTFSMAFEPTSQQAREFSGGLLWIAFAFSAMLALSRTFAREVPNDCLQGLQMAPISPAAVYLGKLFSNIFFLGLLEVLLVPLFSVFYNVPIWGKIPQLLLIVLLGSWGLAAIGTTFAALTTTIRLREMMLPVLLFPVEIPLILSLVEATTAALRAGDSIVNPGIWLRIAFGFDVIFTLLSLYLFAYILEE
ncbi:MAG: heme exporter protein CcmB, partial [bacterium]|nr:heme exporter protein CcmB [bacterium]